ncbi:MAG TPA: glucose-6-phosphate isomerase [Deltaproteobacteria bacterium]|nr:MAG: glucose-6-phosphate isomerase [Deltaproteobacteria bacterium]HEC31109.1 glucose-6-phosphate isomerase [Deltaproteobacteria bacterium]
MKRWEDNEWSSSMEIEIDLTYGMAEKLGDDRGISPAEIDQLTDRITSIHQQLTEGRKSGRLGFYELPYNDTAGILKTAKMIRNEFKNLVVLGIGGSALGTIAIQNALNGPFRGSREDHVNVFVTDNVDPDYFGSLLETLDIKETCFLVISKSGTTAETMSQFMVVRDLVKKSGGENALSRQIFAITDPEKGCLREIALEEKYTILTIPPAVGGRFSVLSPVGLLPAAVMGVDIDEMLAGARHIDKKCADPRLWENPAYTLGAVYYLADRKKGQNILVFMPYSNRLYSIADWLRQLIAESLGKKYSLDGKEIFVGPTPIKALGTTDQHSQLQLYMEGPFNKMITFFRVQSFDREVSIPVAFQGNDALNYLSGKDLGTLINAEQTATAIALAQNGRANITVTVPSINPFTIGQIFFLFEVTTVFMGSLYNINPLDQPGVEESKKNTYAIMGRKGYEQRAKEISSELTTSSNFIL